MADQSRDAFSTRHLCPCDLCKGGRYNRETLDIRYKGKTISEVLAMTVAEACDFFSAVPVIKRKLDTLMELA
ncbi:MAG: hypothetical protein Ct9H300mP14_08320 [Gammaproteobacteria bacterium]|nr:MAG: hypothetical protein Ct9H300mP14_08320 [Gammaproteobacteria bacterium]